VVVSFIVGCVVIPGNENILFYLISGIDGKGWGYLGGGYFCPGSKNSIIEKTQRKLQDMTELSTNCVTFPKFHW
jgi:hypothetical protein